MRSPIRGVPIVAERGGYVKIKLYIGTLPENKLGVILLCRAKAFRYGGVSLASHCTDLIISRRSQPLTSNHLAGAGCGCPTQMTVQLPLWSHQICPFRCRRCYRIVHIVQHTCHRQPHRSPRQCFLSFQKDPLR